MTRTPDSDERMVTLYHECSPEDAELIREAGLVGTESFTAATVDVSGGRFHQPADVPTTDAQDYALGLVYRLLDENRPEHLPPHNGSVFFFGSTEHTMCRERRITFEIPLDEFEVVAAPWQVANDLFVEVMQEFEIANSYDEDTLRGLVEEYWKAAFRVTEPEQVRGEYEYYVPSDVQPEYITDIEKIDPSVRPSR